MATSSPANRVQGLGHSTWVEGSQKHNKELGNVTRNATVLVLVAVLVWGCSPARHKQAADEDSYRIIREKQEQVFGGADADFSIEKQPLPEFIRGADLAQAAQSTLKEHPTPTELSELEKQIEGLTGKEREEKLQELDRKLVSLQKLSQEEIAALIVPPPPDAVKLNLAQTLELAVVNSRDFQTQKETLFLKALALTYQRYLWGPQPDLTGSVTGTRQGDERSIGAESKLSLGQALASGAKIALNLGANFAEFFTGDRRRAIGSLLSLSFTQPLLRGGGRLVAMENLTQAERNGVYGVRDFARYRKEFSVQVAQEYYSVIQARDSLINNFRNYISLLRGRIRSESLQKENKANLLDVQEAKQQELSAKNRWISGHQAYLDQLDRFKISSLCVPTEAPIVLDEKELEILKKGAEGGLPSPQMSVEKAQGQALGNRLDLMTAENALEDSERAVAIARDALRAGLDISISSSTETEAPTKALKFQFDEGTYSAGLIADLPINRRQERNAYRQALISLESQKRSLSLLKDNIKLEVRQAYRTLEQLRQSYEIQKMSVDLSEVRLDNAKMQRDEGLISAFDLLRSEESLLSAQNALTAALIDYQLARLRLYLSTEELQVDVRGLWVEENPTVKGDQDVETTRQYEPDKEERPKS